MEECGVNAHKILTVSSGLVVRHITNRCGTKYHQSLVSTVKLKYRTFKPMTAVAEGASLFAESIDWSSEDYQMKSTRGQISSA